MYNYMKSVNISLTYPLLGKEEEKRRRKAVPTLSRPRIPSERSHAVVPNHLHPKNMVAVLGRTAARIHGHPHGVDHGRHWRRHLRYSGLKLFLLSSCAFENLLA